VADATTLPLTETLAPPPSAFLPSPEEEAERDRRDRAIDQVEGRKIRKRRWVGRLGWAVAGVAIGANFAQSFVTASLFPLKEIKHAYTVLRDDGTAQVYRTTWDLPESKTDELIQATAVRYTKTCESWSWVHAREDYNLCIAISAGERHAQYRDYMDPVKNPNAPQNKLGQHGLVRIFPTGVRRVGQHTIRVFYIRVERERPDTPPKITRMVAVHDYAPVTELPADLKLNEPLADVLFVRTETSVDTSPIALNPELAPQQTPSPDALPQGAVRR
jgi:type IV secretory pathway component VirB8